MLLLHSNLAFLWQEKCFLRGYAAEQAVLSLLSGTEY